jgi:hypothetical protein
MAVVMALVVWKELVASRIVVLRALVPSWRV